MGKRRPAPKAQRISGRVPDLLLEELQRWAVRARASRAAVVREAMSAWAAGKAKAPRDELPDCGDPLMVRVAPALLQAFEARRLREKMTKGEALREAIELWLRNPLKPMAAGGRPARAPKRYAVRQRVLEYLVLASCPPKPRPKSVSKKGFAAGTKPLRFVQPEKGDFDQAIERCVKRKWMTVQPQAGRDWFAITALGARRLKKRGRADPGLEDAIDAARRTLILDMLDVL